MVYLPRADSDSLHAALVTRTQNLPLLLMRSITWAPGQRMAHHRATADILRAPGRYFFDSRSPWQLGSTENTTGLPRYFPLGVSLANYSSDRLPAVEDELNRRPRMILQDRCGADLFFALLALDGPSVLRR